MSNIFLNEIEKLLNVLLGETKMVKKLIVGFIIVFSLSVIVLGWDKTVSYFEGAKEQANKELDEKVPMEFESSRIQALIRTENERIFDYEDRIGDLEGRQDSAKRKIDDAKKQLAGQMATLKKIKTLLDQKEEKYKIGNNIYSFAEVNNDALSRLKDVSNLKETIAFHESLVNDLDGAIKQGRGNLGECRKKLVELTTTVESLKARNANADIRMEVASLANSLAGAPLAADNELEKAFRNYERRVSQKESRATSRLNSGKANYRIDYDTAFVTEDAATEIGKFFGQDLSVDEVTVATPVDKPNVAIAIEEINQQ